MTDRLPHHSDDLSPCAATAADAAVLQLAEEPIYAENSVEPVARIEPVRHPSARLHDTVLAEVVGVVRDYAGFKNVAVREGELECLAQISLQKFSRKELRDVLACKPFAIEWLRSAVDFVLDVVATGEMMRALHAAWGGAKVDEALLFTRAEAAVRNMNIPVVNDRRGMRIWPDLNRIIGEMARTGENPDYTATERVQLPAGAKMRCSVKMQRKSDAALLRAATPNRDGYFDG